jgi:hypothetical protein
MDPALAAYYEKLRLVIAGPLFSATRLQAILGLQTGAYDDLLLAYRARHRNPVE